MRWANSGGCFRNLKSRPRGTSACTCGRFSAPLYCGPLNRSGLESHKARLSERKDRQNRRRGAVTSLHAARSDDLWIIGEHLRQAGREAGPDPHEAIKAIESNLEFNEIDLPHGYCSLTHEMTHELCGVVDILGAFVHDGLSRIVLISRRLTVYCGIPSPCNG